MTDQPSAATPMNAAAIPMNRVSASTPLNAANNVPKPGMGMVTGKTILSVDLGRTSTKTCINREPNNVMFVPANVKQMTMEQVRGGVFEARATDPLMDLWLEYQGNGYAVGQLAADFGANLGVGQSKVEDALIKVLACAGYFKLKDEISVILGLPFLSLEQFEKEKAQLIAQVGGPHVMNFRGEPVNLTVSKVWVMPEGYGSFYGVKLNRKKDPEFPILRKFRWRSLILGIKLPIV